MEKPNHVAVQLSALESVIRAMLKVKDDKEINEIEKYLTSLWDSIEESNTHQHISLQLSESKKLAISLIQSAKQ